MYKLALDSKIFLSKEGQALTIARALYPERYYISYFNILEDVPVNYIPIGRVEWVECFIGRKITPDYYPSFLKDYFNRKIWFSKTLPENKNTFIKPADTFKRFTGNFVYNIENIEGPFWCSEAVEFKNEWRYYITNGKVIYSAWYKGEEECSPPKFPENIVPKDWSGTIDMGITKESRFTLVEAHKPFACGWYGHLHEGNIYADWLINGFMYMEDK